MYARIVRRRIKPGVKSEYSKEVRSIKAPNPSKAKGIKAYLRIDSGPDEITTVAVFDTAEDLANWTKTCQEYYGEKTSGFLSSDPKDILVIAGDVKAAPKDSKKR